MVREDDAFLPSVFEQLRNEATTDERRRELAGFVRELCSLSQTLQPTSRDEFFRQLGDLGVLQSIEVLLSSDDSQSHRLAIDVFAHVIEHSPSMVRDYARKEASEDHGDGEDDMFLFNLIIEEMIYDSDPELGGAIQVTGLIRVLVDPESMLANKNEKTEFLAFYYRNCMHVLMAPLLANTADEKRPGRDDYKTAHLLSLILDLLTFSVEHHTYHIKNYILNKDLLRRVLVLLNSKHAFLSLSALRFMRKIVGTKDEFYFRYIVKGDLFTPVVDALIRCGKRYNLLNSTILEMFEFIHIENLRTLMNHIAEKHYKQLQDIDYTKTFKELKKKYDNRAAHRTSGKPDESPMMDLNHRYRRDARELEEEEELWFEKEDELEIGDSFDSPKINIDTILEEKKPEPTEKLEPPLPSNGTSDEAVKNGLVGLVDYSDDDSDDDDTTEAKAVDGAIAKPGDDVTDNNSDVSEPVSKKPRLLEVTDD